MPTPLEEIEREFKEQAALRRQYNALVSRNGLSKQAAYSQRQYAAAAEIGAIPDVVNSDRKEECRSSLLKFLTTYFPNSTGLRPFSDDHKRVIDRIQSCIMNGGRYANAVYRGFAKTTITENAALWATLYGHRKFVAIFGATDDAAKGNIESIKRELQENPLLAEDFPEACHAIHSLEGKPQRCSSQTCNGEPTYIQWTSNTVVLPSIKDSRCSGAILTSRGLTGSIRGMTHKCADGTQQRPDFIFIDDPQTSESANSDLQVFKRMQILKKDILRLGGQLFSIACVVNGTVIQENDLMDTLLDQKKSPSWQSERIKMMRKQAKNHESLWMDQYAKIRTSFDPQEVGDQHRAHRDANAFYIANRAAMDEGCEVSWDWCFIQDTGDPGEVPEISSIQHAYNLLIDDGEDVFASECQNEPLPKVGVSADDVSADQITAKINGITQRTVPAAATSLTAFVDVQQKLLYWSVCGWEQNFSGYVLDYGAWPDPRREWFTLKDARRSMQHVYPAGGIQGAIYSSLETLCADILGSEWKCDDGSVRRVGRCMIDANWGDSTDTVYQFCRQSPFAGVLYPSHGRYYGATTTPMNQYKRHDGEQAGHNWLITGKAKRGIRYAIFDTNYWKSFIHDRLRTPMGGRGCLSLYGSNPTRHRLIASHLTSEYRTRVEAKNRVVDEWKLRPERPDNHWFDCLVGCAVGASMLGCNVIEKTAVARPKRKRASVDYL